MKHYKNLLDLLRPSWVVTVIAGTIAVFTPLLIIVLTKYQASDLKLQVLSAQTHGPATTGNVYQGVADNLASNQVLGSAPLFIVWACIGLGVYYLTIAIVRAFSEVVELEEELEYVHVSRASLVHEALLHFGVRAAAALAWFGFIKLTMSVIVPYAVALAGIASLELNVLSVGYVLLAAAILYVDICGQAVFLRLIALKPRIFG